MRTIAWTAMFVSICVAITANVVAAPAGDAAAGKALFEKKCASCHGAAGEGKDAIAKMMKVEMKNLGSKEVQSKSDAELMKAIKEGTGKMKAAAGLSDKDAQDIVSFVRTLKK